jgi:hypothetical protein
MRRAGLRLLGHGFSFAVERALCRGAYFQVFRRQEQVAITDDEREALTRPLDDPDLFGLAVVPSHVVHPGLLGGWLVSKPPVPRRTPDEAAR